MEDLLSLLPILLIVVPLAVFFALQETRRQYDCPKCGGTMKATGKRGGFLWGKIEMQCPSCGHRKWFTPSAAGS